MHFTKLKLLICLYVILATSAKTGRTKVCGFLFFYWLPFNLLRLLLLLYFAADNKPRIQTEASALLSSCSSPVLALLLRSSAESETSICSFFVGIFLSPLSVEQAAFHSNQITESERPLHWAECKEVKKEAHVSAPPGRGVALPAARPTSLTIRGGVSPDLQTGVKCQPMD